MSIIGDGTGTGHNAKVTSSNKLEVSSVSKSDATNGVEAGDGYNINTGSISLTAAGTLLYLKNNEDRDLIITSMIFGLGSGTFSDSAEITVEKNPTGGDLITDATAVDMNENRHLGSSNTLSINVYKGKSGGTSTGGVDAVFFYVTGSSRTPAPIELTLSKGDSVAITIDPKLSSGTLKVYTAAVCHLKDTTL